MSSGIRSQLIKYGYDCKQFFLSSKGKSVYTRTFKDNDIEVYPEIYSGSKEYFSFLLDMYEELNKQFTKTSIKDGMHVSAPITSDFSKIKTKAGSIRVPSFSKCRLASDQSIVNDRSLQLLKLVQDIRYSGTKDTYGSVSSNSSSGAPLFVNEAEPKIANLKLIENNIENFLGYVRENNLSKLYEEYGVLFFANNQIRRQPDSWSNGKPKVRDFRSLLDSIEGKDPVPYSDRESFYYDRIGVNTYLASCRTRSVFGYSSIINYFMTAAVAGVREYADEKFAFTYKHRTGDEVCDKLRNFGYFKGLDVKNFDNSISPRLINAWIEGMPFSDEGKRICQLLFFSPVYDSVSRMASGFPLDYNTFKYSFGLPSGIFCTSMMGKDIMSSQILLAYEIATNTILERANIEKILLGKHSFAFLNQGDDSIIMAQSDILDKVVKSFEQTELSVVEEEGIVFLGNIYYKDSNVLKYANNLESYLAGAYVPERGINTKLRPFPMLGLKTRRELYRNHPLFESLYDIEKRLFKKHFRTTPEFLEDKYMKVPDNNLVNVLQSSDIEVLTNFNKLYYKFSDSDINPKIREMFSSNIPENIGHNIRKQIMR